MVLPNFIVLGTPKSATKSIATYCSFHPDICFAKAFEPHYFAREEAWNRGKDWYLSLFDHYAGEKAIGEKSWRYACFDTYPHAWERLTASIPRFKAIYVAREPLARALSMWRELRDSATDRIADRPGHSINHDRIIVETSLYHRQIAPVIEALGRENVLLMTFEDFRADQQAFFNRLCDFLEIGHFTPAGPINENPSAGQREDGAIASLLREMGVVDRVATFFPSIKPLGRRLLRRPLGTVTVSEEDGRRFLAMVEEDSRKFLALAGKPEDFWHARQQLARTG